MLNPRWNLLLKDSKGATSGTFEKIFEPDKRRSKYNSCRMNCICDEDGTLYYINDSRYLFAVGKKVSKIKHHHHPKQQQ